MKLATSPGIAVTICVDDVALQEYDDPEAGANEHPLKRVKYVEAASGLNFSLHLHTVTAQLGGSPKDEINWQIFVDGKRAIGYMVPVRALLSYSQRARGIDRKVRGVYMQEKFKFAALNTEDGPLRNLKPADFKQLGEIEVRCTFARRRGASRPLEEVAPFFAPSTGDKALPEKVLKGRAISNQVSLSSAEPLGYTPQSVETDYPYGKEPFATYIFKYRSHRDLQTEHIIPRDPTPIPLEERDFDTLTGEEALELLRRNRAKETEQARIKDEHAKIKKEKRDRSVFEAEDNAGDDDFEITGESQSNKRARMSTDSGVEIVTLTDE